MYKSKQEAIDAGGGIYDDGSTCGHGHRAPRRVLSSFLLGRQRGTSKCEACRKGNRKKHRPKDKASKLRACINGGIHARLAGRRRNFKVTKPDKLLGMWVEEYIEFIAGQFHPGMTWDNWGTYWEIDHINPCCEYDLTKEKEVLQCFNYMNTRPLLKQLNGNKGARSYKSSSTPRSSLPI